jgi:repressor LexA
VKEHVEAVTDHHINQLERKGYLKRDPYNPRNYQVVDGGPEDAIARLNLYGMASCGPTGSILDGDPIDRIPIAARLLSFPALEGFMVRAKGRSMEPKIHQGDLVIARRTNEFVDGKVYVCVNAGECLIKQVTADAGKMILVSFNRQFQPIIAAEDFRVEGEVSSIISGKI